MNILYDQDDYSSLYHFSSEILTFIDNHVVKQFCKWKAEHPDVDTAKIEREIADTVWALIKTSEQLATIVDNAPSLPDSDEDGEVEDDAS